MRVVLIGAGLEGNLSIGYLVPPLLERGHEVEVKHFDAPAEQLRLVDELAAAPPDVIGMSVAFQHRLVEFRDLSRTIRTAGLDSVIVWGGHIPTARPGQILEHYPEVDFIVRHDGEETLADLVDAIAEHPVADAETAREIRGELLGILKDTPGLAFRLPGGRTGATDPRPAVKDLDGLEFPWRENRPSIHAGLGFSPILGSRGCWGKCTYCSIQTYHRGRKGPRVRLRKPEHIAEEIAELYHSTPARLFCFHDENFYLPQASQSVARIRQLTEALGERRVGRIGLVAKCRPDELTDEVIVESKKAGMLRVYVGIENGSQPGLDHLGRGTTVAQCRQALRLLRKHDLYACFNILLFEPDTTLEDVADNVAFLNDCHDIPWNFCRAEVYPGSLLERKLQQEGRLRGGLEGMTYTIADPRAELLFRITAVAFHSRNFGTQSTANAASGAGYLAALLGHFYPRRHVAGFQRDVGQIVQELSRDTLARLDEAYRFVLRGDAGAGDVRRFSADLAEKVTAADAGFWIRLEAAREAMNRFGLANAHKVLEPGKRRVSLTRAAALVAAAGLATSACDDSKVVDPLPDDIGDGKDISVVDPLPDDVLEFKDVRENDDGGMIVDPLPPDLKEQDYMVVDPLPPDVNEDPDVMVVDPLPPDVTEEPDYMVVDPLPPDVTEEPDYMVVDPPPPDVTEEPDYMVVDPPPPDVTEKPDVPPPVDPPPPDLVEEDATSDVPPPVDPPPPDQGAGPDDRLTPSPIPLDRSFRVRLEVTNLDGELHLQARVKGATPDRIDWLASGGTLKASGDQATFHPDGTAPPFILVKAQARDSLLDIDTHLPG